MSSAGSWPTAAHFATILQDPKVAFRDAELQQVVIEKDPIHPNQARVWSGAFANVYRANFPDGQMRAVRVFTSAVAERQERYQIVAQHMKRLRLNSLVPFEYSDKGIRSAGDGRWYPLVTMDWVSGETLYEWVRKKCLRKNRQALRQASDLWVEVVRELNNANIAHGDLQHANVMVSNSSGPLKLKLVDYDCMCVPSLVGRRNLEIGVEPYQHPKRNWDTRLGPNLDNFSALVILVALRALAEAPELWETYVERPEYDKLLFHPEDFSAPQDSELIRTLQHLPDRELPRLCKALVESLRREIDGVPKLGEVLASVQFSPEDLKRLLDARKYDEALDHLEGASKPITGVKDRALQARLHDAKKRVECRLALDQAAAAGDEKAMQRLCRSKLLENYPKAEQAVRFARQADRVIPVLQQLQNARRAKSPRQLVRIWDANQSLLADRKSAEPLAAEVRRCRDRNGACDKAIGAFRRIRQQSGDVGALDDAIKQLDLLGGHPDFEAHRADAAKLLKQGRAWSAFCKLPQTDSEACDRQLDKAWKDDLFAGWPPAKSRLARVNRARKRLGVLEKLGRQVAAPFAEEGEKGILNIAKPLPASYTYDLKPRVDMAAGRLKALRRLERGFREDSDSAIFDAWGQLDGLQATALAPAARRSRIELAKKRAPLLAALGQITPDYPPKEAPRLDGRLRDAWDEALLNDCREAGPWRAAYKSAKERKGILDQLREAVAGSNSEQILQLLTRRCLKGYPLPIEWKSVIQRARADARGIRNLLVVLQGNRRPELFDVFDARIIRQNPTTFEPHRPRLEAWLPTEILPAAKLKLATPTAHHPMEKAPGKELIYRCRWTWPHVSFSEKCILVVCSALPQPGANPRKMSCHLRQPLNRQLYEEGGGSYLLSATESWLGSHVLVWAEIDLGYSVFFSEFLVLGCLDPP